MNRPPVEPKALELLDLAYNTLALTDDYEHPEAISRNLAATAEALCSIAASLISLTQLARDAQ